MSIVQTFVAFSMTEVEYIVDCLADFEAVCL